jgi:hypothetical protein
VRDHHYRTGKRGLVLYLSDEEHADLQRAAERWQTSMTHIARNAIAEAVGALSVVETPREAKVRQEREAEEIRKAMAAEMLTRVEPVVRPTRPVRPPPPPLDMRDGFDDLAAAGWEVRRPAGGERHRLGYLPGTVARRRYGTEHVADPRGIEALGIGDAFRIGFRICPKSLFYKAETPNQYPNTEYRRYISTVKKDEVIRAFCKIAN